MEENKNLKWRKINENMFLTGKKFSSLKYFLFLETLEVEDIN